MRPRFLSSAPFDPDDVHLSRSGTQAAMRTLARRRFRRPGDTDRAALVHLVCLLQGLPSRTYTGEVYPAQTEAAAFLRRHRRRIARIGGLVPATRQHATFLVLRMTTLGRSRRPQRDARRAVLRRRGPHLPVYSDVEIECAALMALWVDAWFDRNTRKFLVVESEFAPSCEPVTDILCWSHLPSEWGRDRVEIFEALIDDGLRVNEAREIAERL